MRTASAATSALSVSRRTVDEDEIKRVPEWRQHGAKATFALRERNELDFGAREVAIGRNEHHAVDVRRDEESSDVVDQLGPGQRFVDGPIFRGLALLTDAAREVSLRIDVDEQDSLVGQG